MPEIPNVVAGEPVESDWGNDIRDRSVQRYPDQTALEVSQPFPAPGETVWLDDPGIMQTFNGALWVPLTPVWENDWQQPSMALPTQVYTLSNSLTFPDRDGVYLIEFSGTLRLINNAGTYSTTITFEIGGVPFESFLLGQFADASYSLPFTFRVPSTANPAGQLLEVYAQFNDPGSAQANLLDRLATVRWVGVV